MINEGKTKIYNFLKWTEKWTKTDMVYLAKGGFWLSVGQVVTTAAAFLLSIAFANLLPVDTFGQYRYVMSIATLLSIPTLNGILTAINRASAKGYDAVLFTGIKTSIKWGVLGGIASLVLSIYYYTNQNFTLFYSFLIIAIFTPFIYPLDAFNSYLQGKKEFELSTKYNIIREVSASLLIGGILFFTDNLVIIIFGYFAYRTFIRFILLQFTVKKVKPNEQYDKEYITFGKHLSLIGVLGTIAGQYDKLLIWHFLGSTQLAIFSIALAPVDQMIGFFSKSLSTLTFPKLSANTNENLKKTLPTKILKLTLITTILAFTYIAFSPLMFKIFFPQYIDSVRYTILYAIVFALIPLTQYNTALTAQGQSSKLYKSSISSNIINMLVLTIALPLFGIMGAVLTRIIMHIFRSMIIYYYFKKN